MTAMNEQAFIAASFNPLVAPGDAVTALWLAEVTLRLRRDCLLYTSDAADE